MNQNVHDFLVTGGVACLVGLGGGITTTSSSSSSSEDMAAILCFLGLLFLGVGALVGVLLAPPPSVQNLARLLWYNFLVESVIGPVDMLCFMHSCRSWSSGRRKIPSGILDMVPG